MKISKGLLLFIALAFVESSAENQFEERRRSLQCDAGNFRDNTGVCAKCWSLIPNCETCTVEGECLSCESRYAIRDRVIKDYSNPESGATRIVKYCEDSPFWRSIVGMCVLILGPIILGLLIAIAIKIVTDRL